MLPLVLLYWSPVEYHCHSAWCCLFLSSLGPSLSRRCKPVGLFDLAAYLPGGRGVFKRVTQYNQVLTVN